MDISVIYPEHVNENLWSYTQNKHVKKHLLSYTRNKHVQERPDMCLAPQTARNKHVNKHHASYTWHPEHVTFNEHLLSYPNSK